MVNVLNTWDHEKATKCLSRGSLNAEKTIWYIHQKEHIIYQYLIFSKIFVGFPGGSDGKGSACSAGDQGLISWRREWLPTPVFLFGEFYEHRSLVGYSPWGHKKILVRFL